MISKVRLLADQLEIEEVRNEGIRRLIDFTAKSKVSTSSCPLFITRRMVNFV